MRLLAAALSTEWYFADTVAKTSPWSALARVVVVLVFAHGAPLDGPQRAKGYTRGGVEAGHDYVALLNGFLEIGAENRGEGLGWVGGKGGRKGGGEWWI